MFQTFKFTILGLILVAQSALAALQIQPQAFTHKGYALHLASYQDTAVQPATPYPDILMVHGLTYSSHQFDLQFENYSLARALAKQGYRVWLLDITGYGHSQKPKDGFIVDSDYAAEDIHAAADYILKKNKVSKLNVFGWSWGTITTSRYAVAHPEQVNKLILFAPIINSLALNNPTTPYKAYTDEAAGFDFQKDPNVTEPAVLKQYLLQTRRNDGAGSPNGGRRDLSQPKTVRMIPYDEFKVHVLFIGGDHDPYLSAEADLKLLMKAAPQGSKVLFMPGAGHAAFLEKPYRDEFQQGVIDFLK